VDYIPAWQNQLYIKVSTAEISNTVQEVEKLLNTISGDANVAIQFLDEHFEEVYKSERQLAAIIGIIGGLAISIACLGLFSLAAFVIVRRTKEIGIRKVLGASVQDIVRNLSKEFIRLVIIAFIIASPIVWYMMNQWLQDFAYRISIQWWMFALAGMLTMLVALITVGSQAIQAAIANPVKSLRSE
jgi:putative ABC transport system permease protein